MVVKSSNFDTINNYMSITWQKVCIEVEIQRLWISGTLALSGTVGGT